jgi:pantoate--beta-alanine ligase
MIVARTIAECRAARSRLGRVALVPTMGALHAGHVSLMHIARSHAVDVAVSIFVNPTQFAPHEDFNQYPRPVEADLKACRDAGVSLVFMPEPAEVYRPGSVSAEVSVPALAGVLEGVVAKLFNIVRPEVACFGEKDFQQLAILRAMTTALDFPIAIVGCPTLRDPDGLAMSSRNQYLSPAARRRALCISGGLNAVTAATHAGARDVATLKKLLRRHLTDSATEPDIPVHIDYATLVDTDTLAEVDSLQRPTQAVVAMRVDKTRLIDNVRVVSR